MPTESVFAAARLNRVNLDRFSSLLRPVKLFILAIIVASIPIRAFAHIGEDDSQIQSRYGAPLPMAVEPRKPATIAKAYEKNGIHIQVHYLDGRACFIEFRGLKLSERPDVLKTFEDGHSWSNPARYNTSSLAYMRSDGVMARSFGVVLEIFTKTWFDASEAASEVERKNRIKGL